MDSYALERIVSGGLHPLEPTELTTIVDWCWDHGINSGDARYCVLWRVLHEVDEWWDPEQGLPALLFNEVDTLVRLGIANVLAAPDAATGARIAHNMGMELPLARTPEQWRAGGWLDES